MSRKTTSKFFLFLVYNPVLPKVLPPRLLALTPSVFSLEVATYSKFGNTGRLFKAFAFIGLAFSCLAFKNFKTLTIRSVMLVLWNTIATYTQIF